MPTVKLQDLEQPERANVRVKEQAMSENLKTIKELADELGVSKNKIHYQVSKISSEYVVRNNGMKLLTAIAV
ncbi:hypothetical protein EsVE80_p2-00010 (plasmid) [Enterococcus saigonensis]|uniref:Uncharacterized protein n=1 Tax=Enterococcus saigonensis TaxID=1805431 RepID=A0A679IU17_9ENTE|nr:hypothetical protein EsVE80_p2-00010 [Enterococcus saigonensis]